MATQTGFGKWLAKSLHQMTWPTMANGDTGNILNASNLPDKTVSITGTFGSGGSVSIEGDNVDGTQGIVLKDANGNALTFTAKGVAPLGPSPLFIRPHVTAGDGTTAIDVSIVSTKAK